MSSGEQLAKVGRRGKRKANGIEKAREHFSKLPCICGRCGNRERRQWCHLDGRSEDVLLDYALAVAGCSFIHPFWLDQHPDGVRCRAEMLERARIKGDTLTNEDVEDLLIKYDYPLYFAKEVERRRI